MKVDDFKRGDKESVVSILAPDNEEYSRKMCIWDWQYFENPHAGDTCAGTTISTDDGIVGFIGYIPVELRYNGKDLKGVWGCDLIMSPSCRGKGYGSKLTNAYKSTAPVALGLGSSDANDHMMRKAGYKVNTDIEEFFYTNKPSHARDVPKKIIQYMKMARSITLRRKVGDLKATVIDASSIPADIDLLWNRVESGYTKIVKRTYSYIRWKYASHPLTKYRSIIVTDDAEIVGVGIFRKNNEMSKLVDYVGPSKGRQIKELIVKVFKKECSRSRLLECTCTDEEFQTSLGHSGFRKYKLRPRFHVYSNIENDQDPEKEWFIMAGDSDNDIGEGKEG